MSVVRRRSRRGDGTVRRRSVAAAGWSALLLAAGIAVFGFAGPASATLDPGLYDHGENATDDEPPELVDGTKINDTAIELTFADNHDVDESTIGVSTFLLTSGNVTGIDATDAGTNATVELALEDPVPEDDITVVLEDGSSVQDSDGNELDPSEQSDSVVVEGMDGVPPGVRSFEATDATGQPSRLRIEATEGLDGIAVSVLGPTRDWLDRADFTETSGSSYEATYTPLEEGTVRFILVNVTDGAGNEQPVGIRQRVDADLVPPDAVAGIDFAASGNLTLAFDGGRSADTNGVANYTWAFGDGTTATGERVTHTFLPGNYTVTLTASDPSGNEATDSLTLNLTAGAGNVTDVSNGTLRDIRTATGPRVTVDRGGEAGDTAIASVRDARAGVPFAVGDGGNPLARRGPVSLAALNVTLATNTSLDLAVSATGPGAVRDAAAATDATALGGLTVVHSVPDGAVDTAVFTFAVEAGELRAAGAAPGNVSLARSQDGEWERLPTTVLNASGETYRFGARSPGFSRFAVVADATDVRDGPDDTTPTTTPTATPAVTPTPTSTPSGGDARTGGQFRLRTAALGQSTVEPGTPVVVNATVENLGPGGGDYVAGLSVDGRVVATRSVTVPANESRTVRLQFVANQTGTVPVGVNGTAAGELTVGGGGLLGSVLGLFGFLPLGLLEPLVVFLGAPALVVFLLLKGLAVYLGY